MNKETYNCILCGLKDKVRDKIINLACDDSLGAYARNVIPQYKEIIPLNDIEIVELGMINPYTGAIITLEKPKYYDWKEVYNFQITNKAVKNESEISTETNKE